MFARREDGLALEVRKFRCLCSESFFFAVIRLIWHDNPTTVLIVKKIGSDISEDALIEVGLKRRFFFLFAKFVFALSELI